MKMRTELAPRGGPDMLPHYRVYLRGSGKLVTP